jgi:hypothetical protein
MARTVALLAVIAGIGWVVGDYLRALVRGRRWAPERRATPERALAAVAGFVALAVTLMVANLVTGGAIFGLTFVVPVVGAGVLLTGVIRRRWPSGRPSLRVIVLAVTLAGLFVLPVLLGGTGARTGDTPWHLGWTQQLLGGQAVPTGPAPVYSRNAYPWGWHAVMATATRLIPGTDPLVAHDALQMMLVYAIPLGAACLARRVRPDAGWNAAAAAGLVGGFGWLLSEEPDFITSPSQARYGADLMVASPNSIYELLPPALPRELALALLAAAGVLLVRAARQGDPRRSWAAGGTLGVTGLVSVPMLVNGLAWAAIAAATVPRGERLRFVARVLVGTGAVVSLWAGPVIADYVRHDGFVPVTSLGVEWPLVTALGAWGLLLPLALAGLVLGVRTASGRAVVAFAAGMVLLLGAAKLRSVLGWELAGNATLLHQGRVWPAAHLLGAAFAGVALARAQEVLGARSRPGAALGVAGILAVGALSPLLASRAVTGLLQRNEGGFTYDRPDLAEGAFARRAAAELGPHDVVRVVGEGGDRLAFVLWQLSGVRLASYDDLDRPSNDLRIRYAALARAWERRMERGGFEPGVVVKAVSPERRGGVVSGEYGDLIWRVTRVANGPAPVGDRPPD